MGSVFILGEKTIMSPPAYISPSSTIAAHFPISSFVSRLQSWSAIVDFPVPEHLQECLNGHDLYSVQGPRCPVAGNDDRPRVREVFHEGLQAFRMLGLHFVGALYLDGHFRLSEDGINLVSAVGSPVCEAILIIMIVQQIYPVVGYIFPYCIIRKIKELIKSDGAIPFFIEFFTEFSPESH